MLRLVVLLAAVMTARPSAVDGEWSLGSCESALAQKSTMLEALLREKITRDDATIKRALDAKDGEIAELTRTIAKMGVHARPVAESSTKALCSVAGRFQSDRFSSLRMPCSA